MQHEIGNREMAAPRFHQVTPLGDSNRSLIRRATLFMLFGYRRCRSAKATADG
jgi:hypothetical protein